MKKLVKKILKWINYNSVSIFAKYHFRKQAKNYCLKNSISDIENRYKKEIIKYWSRYEKHPSTIFHRWYSGCNGIKDVRYIPEDFFYDVIERYYNDMDLEPAYVDKGMYGIIYPDIKQPETVFINMNGIFYDKKYNIISIDMVCELLATTEKVIIKPTRDTGGGKNVRFVESYGITKEDSIKLLDLYKKDYIVQLPLRQHSDLSILHKESINTIRVMSMLEVDRVSIVSTVIRMGIGESCVDNECSGGINCWVDKDGKLSDVAYNGSGQRYEVHPDGFKFSNHSIPSYDKIITIITEQHKKLPYFGLISWDFTVDEDGEPVMVELNMRWCGLNFHQLHNGPLFGDRTDEILNNIMVIKNE